tara:strand:+ start:588 stop:770 length:183 start_codon:yes stop_codon:yes gene_type:complete
MKLSDNNPSSITEGLSTFELKADDSSTDFILLDRSNSKKLLNSILILVNISFMSISIFIL